MALFDLEVDIAQGPDIVGGTANRTIINLPYFQIGIVFM